MTKYDREMNMLRSGETLPTQEEVYDPYKDIAAHTSKLKRPAVEQESYLSKEQLKELRRVQHERVEVSCGLAAVGAGKLTAAHPDW